MKSVGKLFALIAMMVWLTNAQAQAIVRPHVKSLTPASSRFEIVQSQIVARDTFLLDKYTGSVYQVVKKTDGDITWQEVPRSPHPLDEESSGKVNFQIFASGIVARDTFLTNVNTGATWQLAKDSKSGQVFWSPIL